MVAEQADISRLRTSPLNFSLGGSVCIGAHTTCLLSIPLRYPMGLKIHSLGELPAGIERGVLCLPT